MPYPMRLPHIARGEETGLPGRFGWLGWPLNAIRCKALNTPGRLARLILPTPRFIQDWGWRAPAVWSVE